jgi:hypothetical protein
MKTGLSGYCGGFGARGLVSPTEPVALMRRKGIRVRLSDLANLDK